MKAIETEVYLYAGEYLKAARLRKGWTQAEFGRRVGVSDNTVLKWEKGQQYFRFDRFMVLCAALGVDASDVVASIMQDMPSLATGRCR